MAEVAAQGGQGSDRDVPGRPPQAGRRPEVVSAAEEPEVTVGSVKGTAWIIDGGCRICGDNRAEHLYGLESQEGAPRTETE